MMPVQAASEENPLAMAHEILRVCGVCRTRTFPVPVRDWAVPSHRVAEFVECDPIDGRTADHQRQRRGDDEGDRPPAALRACVLKKVAGVAGGTANPEVQTERCHGIAIGLIGGLFDIVADWVLDVPAAGPSPDAVEELITRLSDFYGAVRNGS